MLVDALTRSGPQRGPIEDPPPALAGLGSLNFFVLYTDLHVDLPDGGEWTLVRTYNSQSRFDGLFGIGWGSDFDTYLNVLGDRTVVLHNFGSGQRHRYLPPLMSRSELDAAVAALLRAQVDAGELRPDPDAIAERHRELLDDEETRGLLWRRLSEQGRLPRREIDAGTGFRHEGKHTGSAYLLRTLTGYLAVSHDEVRTFDDAGRLLRIERPAKGLVIELKRDGRGRLLRAHAGDRAWTFELDRDGHVADVAVVGDNWAGVDYKYRGGRLINTTDRFNNYFDYDYDRHDRLERIGYRTGRFRSLTYAAPGSGRLRSDRSKDGDVTWYEQGELPVGADGTGTFTSLHTDSDRERHEWIRQTAPDGMTRTVTYHIERDGEETLVDYGALGHVRQVRLSNGSGGKTLTLERNAAGRVQGLRVAGRETRLVYGPDGWIREFSERRDDAEPLHRWITRDADGRPVKYVSEADDRRSTLTLRYSGHLVSEALVDDTALSLEYNQWNDPHRLSIANRCTLEIEYFWGPEVREVKASGESPETCIEQLDRLLALSAPPELDPDFFADVCLECELPGLAQRFPGLPQRRFLKDSLTWLESQETP